uniref:SET domain-containing protein n=1 Tax=Caenorhabditis japonica TaxID=281687 RepID=A0A8R1I2D9_CAEJA
MNYEKIRTSQPGPGISEDEWNDEFDGCDCENECSAEKKCSCLMGGSDNYSNDFKLLPKEGTLLVECSDKCSCSWFEKTCRNRLLQNGIKKSLKIFETSVKGHGVKAGEPIRAGEFVCEYAGEVLGEEEVERRCEEFKERDNYTLTLKEHFGVDNTLKTFIDPRLRGNIGRFLNHSCDPNCEVVIVRLGRMIPTAGIFAKRDIQSGEELCYDYGSSAIKEGEERKL